MNEDLIVVTTDQLSNLIFDNVVKALEQLKENEKATKKQTPKKVLLTRKETAKLLGVCLATIDNWTRQGKLQKHRNGNAVRYHRDEVIASFDTLQRYQR